MKKNTQYIQIESTRHYDNAQHVPVINLQGYWLTLLGFEVNHMIQVETHPSKIVINATHKKSNFSDLVGPPHDHSRERELIDTQRLNASNWLNKRSAESPNLKAFMDDHSTYKLTKTILDLVHLLHENNLLRVEADK